VLAAGTAARISFFMCVLEWRRDGAAPSMDDRGWGWQSQLNCG
jgi:hypothetical protein